MEAITPEIIDKKKQEGLSPGELVDVLAVEMNRAVSRSAVFRWRQRLNFLTPPFYEDHVEALKIYGNLLGLGIKPDVAKEKTIEALTNSKYAKGEN
jgi:hypothetical protein